MDSIRHRAEAENLIELLDSFSAAQVQEMLADSSTDRVWKAMKRARNALDRLRELEKRAKSDRLWELILSGIYCIRGRDREGSVVLWCRLTLNMTSLKEPFEEEIVFIMWMVLAAARARNPDQGKLLIIWDERDRKVFDMNAKFLYQLSTYMRDLSIVFPQRLSKLWAILPNILMTQVVRLCCRICGQNEHEFFELTTDSQVILDQLADPSDFPDWFADGGKPFHLSFDQAGNILDLVERRCGFERLSLRDFTANVLAG